MIMKRRKSRSPCTVLTVAMLALAIAGSTAINSVAPARAAEPPVFRITPPAPVFDQTKRLDELAARRKRVAEAIGTNSIMILFSAEPRVYTNDVDYHFRQENNLFYLTHLNQKRSVLVLMPGTSTPEILFLPRRNPVRETWDGYMYSPQQASELSGIKEIWEASEFAPFVAALSKRESYHPKPENVLLSSGQSATTNGEGMAALFAAAQKNEGALYLLNFPREGDSREYRQEQRFAGAWPKESGFNVQNASPIFTQLRLRKSPMELAVMQHAIDISIEAHQRAQAFASQAKWEYEVDAQVLYTFKLRNADNWGYPNIVGCGKNATTLHYQESQGPVTPGQLMLMDVGAEYGHYSADVTRTFPVNGKFTKAQ